LESYTCPISGAGILISTIIFATAVDLRDGESYDYAFYLGPVSGAILLLNGLMLGCCIRKDHCTFDDVPLPTKEVPKDLPSQTRTQYLQKGSFEKNAIFCFALIRLN
jgi:hypothetical protein